MPYNKGQGSFGVTKGNMFAMLRQLTEGQGSINEGDQYGAGGLQTIKSTWDFNVDGGAIGTILLNQSLIVPADFVVLGGVVNPIILPTTGGGATIAIGLGNGAQTAALKAATAVASYVVGTPLTLIPAWSSAFVVNALDAKISITIAAGTVTAGRLAIHIVGLMYGQ
jgi:hypothetical protein